MSGLSQADADFAAISAAEWAWRRSGRLPDEDNSDYLAPRLPRVCDAEQQAKLERWQDVLRRLDGIEVAGLSPRQAIDYRVYRFQIETLVADQRFKLWQRPIAGDTAFWSDLIHVARAIRLTEQAYRDYIALLGDIPRYFAENIANMRAGLARGFTSPRITLVGRQASVARILGAADMEDNPFFAHCATRRRP
jgi:uncharacterized protein (DUF885 family)